MGVYWHRTSQICSVVIWACGSDILCENGGMLTPDTSAYLGQWCPNILCATGDCYVKAYFGPSWSFEKNMNAIPAQYLHRTSQICSVVIWACGSDILCENGGMLTPDTSAYFGSGVPIFFVPQVVATSRLTLGLVVGLLKRTWMLFWHNACTGLPKSAVSSFEPVDQTYCARMAACWPLTRLPTSAVVSQYSLCHRWLLRKAYFGPSCWSLKRTWMLFRHNACTGLPKSAVWSFEPVDQTYCARMAACWPLTRLPTWGSGVPIFFVPQVIATSRLTLGLVVGLLKRTWMLFRHNACTGLPKSAVWSFEPVDQTYCARMAACWPLTRLPTSAVVSQYSLCHRWLLRQGLLWA